MQPSGWTQIWVGLGLFLLGFGLPYMMPRDWSLAPIIGGIVSLIGLTIIVAAGISHRRQSRQPNQFLQLPGFEFYASRETLARHRSIADQFQEADELWAYWNSGTQAYTEGIAKTGKLKRLLLPAPDSPGLSAMADAVHKPMLEIATDIKGLTRQAQGRGVEVRWYPGLPANTILLGDPALPDAWLHVELLQGHVGAGERPSFRVEKKRLPSLYSAYLRGYLAMWDASRAPTS